MLSGTLHGFYFESRDRLPVGMAVDASYAVDSSGRRYALSMRKVGARKWDIVLANGQGVSSGTVTYVFVCQTDFARAGYVAPTRSADGRKLGVFNWAPSQWDEAAHQAHYTLTFLPPFALPSFADARSYLVRNAVVLS